MSDEELLIKFEEDIRLRGFSPATIKAHLIIIQVIMRHFADRPIFDLNEQDIRTFLKFLIDEKKLYFLLMVVIVKSFSYK